jgi:hypothetical protein
MVNDVAVIVLDDQPEFGTVKVLVIYFENEAVIANTLVGNGDLGFDVRGILFGAAAVCFAGQGAAKEE